MQRTRGGGGCCRDRAIMMSIPQLLSCPPCLNRRDSNNRKPEGGGYRPDRDDTATENPGVVTVAAGRPQKLGDTTATR